MWKQSLCNTVPISLAIIVAGAFLANAGDLEPPPGDISPTMKTLDEIHGLCSAAMTSGQGQVVSYTAQGVGNLRLVDPVPDGGIVLTDVVRTATSNLETVVLATDAANNVQRAQFSLGTLPSGQVLTTLHFNSGIRFNAGEGIWYHGIGEDKRVTVSGYIPASSP